MPWFPDFVGAVELARRDTQVAGRADPVARYLQALQQGNRRLLEDVWPGKIVVHDPRAGEVRGHKELRNFVGRNRTWLAEIHARAETVAATYVDHRAVVELLAHVDHDGQDLSWPIAVVAESPDSRSVVFRTYCSTWPVDGGRRVRPPILRPGSDQPGDIVGRYLTALGTADVDGIVRTFRAGRIFSGTHWSRCPAPRKRCSPRVLPRMLQRWGRSHARGMRGDRRRRPVRPGIQLPALGLPRPTAPGGSRHLRTGVGRSPCCRPGL